VSDVSSFKAELDRSLRHEKLLFLLFFVLAAAVGLPHYP
jgi:hypothetical protein